MKGERIKWKIKKYETEETVQHEEYLIFDDVLKRGTRVGERHPHSGAL